MPRKKKRLQTIITFLLQGKPFVIMDEELEYPHGFESIDAARKWVTDAAGTGRGIARAESIVVVDLDSGETAVL